MTALQQATACQIQSLKKVLRSEYITLNGMVNARGADCGMSLLSYISADCANQAERVCKVIDELRAIDWDCPKIPAWVVTLAGREAPR